MTKQKQQSLIGLRKAAGILNKVIKMAEEGRYCIDIMQQNLAVIGLLKSAHQKLMEGHLNTCFLEGMKTTNKDKKEELIQELLKVSKLSNK